MCGLGDRDRRPITPPLIAKLICKSRATGRPVPLSQIDTSFLICAVDLWTSDFADTNLTRNVSPTLSCGITPSMLLQSYGSRNPTQPSPLPVHTQNPRSTPTEPERSVFSLRTPPPSADGEHPVREDLKGGIRRRSSSDEHHEVGRSSSTPGGSSLGWAPPKVPSPRAPPSPTLSPRVGHAQPVNQSRGTSIATSNTSLSSNFAHTNSSKTLTDGQERANRQGAPLAPLSSLQSRCMPSHQGLRLPLPLPMPIFSKQAAPLVPNLIGSLHANAFKLTDDRGEPGIFFVLPDLSVRTEGSFRLRLRLMSIGFDTLDTSGQKLPLQATTYTQVFNVVSAKKFDGMLGKPSIQVFELSCTSELNVSWFDADPTPLSKCFAKQGTRIPTRKVARTRKHAKRPAAELEEDDELAGDD
ncbi:BQ5605_C002g01696 [Microbotryum silenes-dioicae]|uniref:BQ5605_C002g01696 protein n=1 Tax=Microbotryum silenes-dioicae TaxID=796604 RepID=A0A2X0LZH2_9BASI|nr:BQ5605_C002g01696 [Microbotryum silenes-dioicae]